MARCWPWNHHWHRFKTTLVRKSDDCVGEELPWYRCCLCRIIRSGIVCGAIGAQENDGAYRVSDDEYITERSR